MSKRKKSVEEVESIMDVMTQIMESDELATRNVSFNLNC
jgi:hypothetical protein